MRAQSVGPPEMGMGNRDVESDAIRFLQLSLTRRRSTARLSVTLFRTIRGLGISAGDNFNLRSQVCDVGANLPGQDVQVSHARVVPGFQRDRPPDAAGDERGPQSQPYW